MDIQAINNIFKDITESITGLNGYAFGWPADRVRGRDPETDAEMEYPRVFFAVPTVSQDVLRNQDIYNITLYFDDLQGYDNAGEAITTTQLGQWSGLQLIAQKWLNEFKARKYEREADYAGINSPVSITLDSFGGMQRMATVQMSFSLVTPSMCAITITLKVARLNAAANATLVANANIVRVATANFNAVSGLVATAVKGGAVIQLAESAMSATASLNAQAQKAKQAESNISATGTLSATLQRALAGQSVLSASGSLDANVQRAKLAQLNAIASATLQALAVAEQQGIQNAYAMLYGVAELSATGQVARQAQLAATGQATLSATAQRAQIAEFNQQATALLSATLAAIRVVSAQFTAQAETSLTAQLSRAVSASVQAQAETSLQAIISRAVSASMTAQGSTSLLAVLANQVVFLASAGGTLSATGKVAKQAAFSRSANGTVSATLKRAVYRSASLTASATLSATGVSAPAYDADAQAFFTAAGITDTTQKNAVNTLVTSLKSAGVWTKMVAIYPFVGGTASSHAVNLRTPGTYNLTFVGGVTHSANGVVGDGTTGYYDTGMPLNTLAQNNMSAFIYSRTNVALTARDIGVSGPAGNGNMSLNARNTSNLYQALFMGFPATTSNTSSLGLFGGIRSASTSEIHCINLTTSTKTSNSEPPNSLNIYGLARNENNIAANFSTRQQAFACLGQSLTTGTSSEYTALYNAVVAYQTALSRNV